MNQPSRCQRDSDAIVINAASRTFDRKACRALMIAVLSDLLFWPRLQAAARSSRVPSAANGPRNNLNTATENSLPGTQEGAFSLVKMYITRQICPATRAQKTILVSATGYANST